jgi:hypothetical protein
METAKTSGVSTNNVTLAVAVLLGLASLALFITVLVLVLSDDPEYSSVRTTGDATVGGVLRVTGGMTLAGPTALRAPRRVQTYILAANAPAASTIANAPMVPALLDPGSTPLLSWDASTRLWTALVAGRYRIDVRAAWTATTSAQPGVVQLWSGPNLWLELAAASASGVPCVSGTAVVQLAAGDSFALVFRSSAAGAQMLSGAAGTWVAVESLDLLGDA